MRDMLRVSLTMRNRICGLGYIDTLNLGTWTRRGAEGLQVQVRRTIASIHMQSDSQTLLSAIGYHNNCSCRFLLPRPHRICREPTKMVLVVGGLKNL